MRTICSDFSLLDFHHLLVHYAIDAHDFSILVFEALAIIKVLHEESLLGGGGIFFKFSLLDNYF